MSLRPLHRLEDSWQRVHVGSYICSNVKWDSFSFAGQFLGCGVLYATVVLRHKEEENVPHHCVRTRRYFE